VLVVDDEMALRRLLRAYLSKAGFDVVDARDGREAIFEFERSTPDVAIVDVMLPELDGFEVVRRLRARSSVPIILLTAKDQERDRVTGLELGADDYVVKPFSAPEVVARVRAQLRRSRGFGEDAIPGELGLGRVTLDPAGRRCLLDGREVDLTRREFDLLAALVQSRGRVLTREHLLERIWETEFVSQRTVDVHVAALRRKLGEALTITALRGVGYRLDS
jgi:two-component system, OmpR family, response regulator RegX3